MEGELTDRCFVTQKALEAFAREKNTRIVDPSDPSETCRLAARYFHGQGKFGAGIEAVCMIKIPGVESRYTFLHDPQGHLYDASHVNEFVARIELKPDNYSFRVVGSDDFNPKS